MRYHLVRLACPNERVNTRSQTTLAVKTKIKLVESVMFCFIRVSIIIFPPSHTQDTGPMLVYCIVYCDTWYNLGSPD